MSPASESAVLDAPVAATTGGTADITVESDRFLENLVLDDLLVEEISIDGMCGVY